MKALLSDFPKVQLAASFESHSYIRRTITRTKLGRQSLWNMKKCICLQGEENRGDPAGFEPVVERDTVLSVIITGSSMLHLPGCYKKSVETCSDIKNISWDFPSEDPEKHPLSWSQHCPCLLSRLWAVWELHMIQWIIMSRCCPRLMPLPCSGASIPFPSSGRSSVCSVTRCSHMVKYINKKLCPASLERLSSPVFMAFIHMKICYPHPFSVVDLVCGILPSPLCCSPAV